MDLNISGVKICFPVKPYSSQVAVMSKVIVILNLNYG